MNKIKKKIQNKFQDKSLKELIEGGGISLMVKLLGVFFAFLFNLYINKIYGANQLGVITSAISILSLCTIFTKFGVDTSFLRFVSIFKTTNPNNIKEIEKKSYILTLTSTIIISVLVYFSAEFIAMSIFAKKSLISAIQIFSFGFLPYTLFSLHSEGLRAVKDIKAYSFIQMSARFMFGFMIIVIFYYCFGIKINLYWSFVTSLYLTLIYSFTVWTIKKRRLLNNQFKDIDIAETSYNKIIKLSFPLMLASSSAFLMNWTDILCLTYFGTAEDVAVFDIAIKFAMLSKIILISINTIAAPKFAEIYFKNDMSELKKFAQNSTKLIFWISLPILLISIIFSKQLLGIYGSEFESANLVLILFTFAQFISSISGSVGHLLNMTGYHIVSQNIVLVSTFLNILLNLFLIPLYGINGAAFSGFCTLVFKNLYSVWFIKRKFGFYTIYIPFIIRK
jgi:O-antigen/teichoic acid export membrane protein